MFGRGRPTCVASPDPDVGLVGESFPAPWRGPGRYRYRQTVGPHGVPWPRGIAHLTMVDPFTLAHRKQIVEFAAQHRLPAIYESQEFVVSGGLVSYGPSNTAMQRRVVVYLDKIFKGTKPSDLPIEQPTTFELVVNVRTAKALGLTVPPSLLARADEVIE